MTRGKGAMATEGRRICKFSKLEKEKKKKEKEIPSPKSRDDARNEHRARHPRP